MIDSRILNTLKSRNENPAYYILITGYETKDDCSQEKLIINLHQINKSLTEIENLPNINILSKDLVIQSDMDYDEVNQSFKTTLKGFSNYHGNVKEPTNTIKNYASHYVEVLEAELKEKIEIEFNHQYTSTPAIIPTIESKYQSYYQSYEIELTTKKVQGIVKYTGVIITFKKLKRKNYYPLINIMIIGDKLPTE